MRRKAPIKSIEQLQNGIAARTRVSVTPEHFDLVVIADDVASKVSCFSILFLWKARAALFSASEVKLTQPGYLLWELIMDRPDSVFPAHNIECW